jgi:protein gp37
MANSTEIEWTDATWNPVTGCTKISAGCDHCYAERFSERFRGTRGHPFETGFDLTLRPERLEQPLRWREGRRAVRSLCVSFLYINRRKEPKLNKDRSKLKQALKPQKGQIDHLPTFASRV